MAVVTEFSFSQDTTRCSAIGISELGLRVEHKRSGTGEADITVQGDFASSRGKPLYLCLCFLQEEKSFWVVWPPPHPANDAGPAFVVPNLEGAVSLSTFLFNRRFKVGSINTGEEATYTQRLYEQWLSSEE